MNDAIATAASVGWVPMKARRLTGLKDGRGAASENRTPDLLITSETLCRLS